MILITSAAYINQELVSEIGKIPPAFLPVGNNRLYHYQIEYLKLLEKDSVYISIPEDYELSEHDCHALECMGTHFIRVENGLSLGESILFCVNSIGEKCESLLLLHGDTLLVDSPKFAEDYYAVSPNVGYYPRATLGKINGTLETQPAVQDEELVICGLFRFSKPYLLTKALVSEKCEFVSALSEYSNVTAVNFPEARQWFDFGHTDSYFQSRRAFGTQRAFNQIESKKNTILKTSADNKKILAEYRWYKELPSDLSIYTPRVLSLQEQPDFSQYELEYIYNLPLSDLFVFGELPPGSWKVIFNACKTFLDSLHKLNNSDNNNYGEFLKLKTSERLKTVDFETICPDITPEISNKLKACIELANSFVPNNSAISYVHGDFCFSNILFNSRSRRIVAIDPRGFDAFDQGMMGFKEYDILKLFHSVFGFYDHIMAGHYIIVEDIFPKIEFNISSRVKSIQEQFISEFEVEKIKMSELHAGAIHLFLSMIPLHSDRPDRQKAMLLNAFRISSLLEENS